MYFSGFSGTEMRETLETLFQSYRSCTGLHKNIYSPAKYELNVTISYYLNNDKIAEVSLIAENSINKISFINRMKSLFSNWFNLTRSS